MQSNDITIIKGQPSVLLFQMATESNGTVWSTIYLKKKQNLVKKDEQV